MANVTFIFLTVCDEEGNIASQMFPFDLKGVVGDLKITTVAVYTTLENGVNTLLKSNLPSSEIVLSDPPKL